MAVSSVTNVGLDDDRTPVTVLCAQADGAWTLTIGGHPGTVYLTGTPDQLISLAEEIEEAAGRVVMFGCNDREAARRIADQSEFLFGRQDVGLPAQITVEGFDSPDVLDGAS